MQEIKLLLSQILEAVLATRDASIETRDMLRAAKAKNDALQAARESSIGQASQAAPAPVATEELPPAPTETQA